MEVEVTPIKGVVAKVLSTREIVINRGSEDGVEPGMEFNILDRNGLNIVDPETGRELGSVHRPKVQVITTQVEMHLSIAKTFRYTETNVGGLGMADVASSLGSVASLFEPPKLVRTYETFRSDEAPWDEIDETHSYVKVGDPVEQVLVIEGSARAAVRVSTSGRGSAESLRRPSDGTH